MTDTELIDSVRVIVNEAMSDVSCGDGWYKPLDTLVRIANLLYAHAHDKQQALTSKEQTA